MANKLYFLFLLLMPIDSFAFDNQKSQQDSIYVGAFKILDGFYETPIENACVSIYDTDSTTLFVDSMYCRKKHDYFYYSPVAIPKRTAYIFRIVCKGYPTTLHYSKVRKAKSAQSYILDPVYIYQNAPETDLSEATVTASRILMVTKGDTIEYNAAAFRMQDGSMLDGLIRALPGVKLDENGKITVNGEFVSSLLVNGRDFFSGDPRVALHNLPAYTVNKVQVYRKNEHAERDGRRRKNATHW